MAKFWSIIAVLCVLAAGFAVLSSRGEENDRIAQLQAELDELQVTNEALKSQLDTLTRRSRSTPAGVTPDVTDASPRITAQGDLGGTSAGGPLAIPPSPRRSLSESLDAALENAERQAGITSEDPSSTMVSTPPPPGHRDTGMPHATGGVTSETPWEALAKEFEIDLEQTMGEDSAPGTGTEDDPKRLNWDLLVGASRTYKPREGQEELPSEILSLDGTWVKLSGYYLFPMAGQEFDEVLMMRNMWDGCCIGVPPTAFSAVLVKLEKPIRRGNSWAMNIGTVRGRMVIDPIVDRGWILSLYVIEEGQLNSESQS